MSTGPGKVLKGVLRAIVLPLARRAAGNARLKRLARMLLTRMPALERRARALVHRPEPAPPRRMHVPLDSRDLSPAAQAAYQELKRRFDTRQS